jgi:serine/threonine protein kinase
MHTNVTHIPIRQILLSNENHVQYENIGDNVRFLQEIGQGEFGRIYLGEFIDSKKKCLIKTLETDQTTDEYLREIESNVNETRHIHVSRAQIIVVRI